MSYDLYVLPVPDGADIEESGEALLARLTLGHERASDAPEAARERSRVADVLRAAEPTLDTVDATSSHRIVGRFPSGVELTVADRYLHLRVPFDHRGDPAAGLFEALFRLLAVAVEETGWRVYDPQEARGVDVDDASRDSTLEIYLSVMDQLNPGAARS